jgi:hypothetical protein
MADGGKPHQLVADEPFDGSAWGEPRSKLSVAVDGHGQGCAHLLHASVTQPTEAAR